MYEEYRFDLMGLRHPISLYISVLCQKAHLCYTLCKFNLLLQLNSYSTEENKPKHVGSYQKMVLDKYIYMYIYI